MKTRDRNKYLFFFVLFFLLGCQFFVYLNDTPRVYPLDDAYIHFVYARNMAAGSGLCFNPGETSFGTSSPLWVMILALCARAGADLYIAALVLSFCAHFLSAMLIFVLCSELGDSLQKTWYPHAAALLYLACGNMTWLSLSGMETAFFHMTCLCCVCLYVKRGYGLLTALAAGMVLLCRITGLFLVLPLCLTACVNSKKRIVSVCVTFLMIVPYYLYHRVVTGLFFPVTARGKLLTYVDGGWDPDRIAHYVFAAVKYLYLYEPVYVALIIFAVTGAFFFIASGRTGSCNREGTAVIFVWGVVHFTAHAVLFRTLNQNIRYLSVLFPLLSLLGTLGVSRVIRDPRIGYAVLCAMIAFSLGNQVSWQRLYKKNTIHMEQVYAACARWINGHSTDRIIAAFDIGFIKYITDRIVVDLGGVTSAEVHPYLATHDAGRYVRNKDVSLIVYSRMPDCDVWPGIYRSVFDRAALLKEQKLATFAAGFYEVPAISHSFQLDVIRIAAWVKPTEQGVREFFYVTAIPRNARSPVTIGRTMELLGLSLDRGYVYIVRNMVQGVRLTYYWRASGPVEEKPIVRTRFINRCSGEVVFDKSHIPTHDVFPPELWGPGKIVREEHVVWLPDTAPPGRYDVWVTDGEKEGADRNPAAVVPRPGASGKGRGSPVFLSPGSKKQSDETHRPSIFIERGDMKILY